MKFNPKSVESIIRIVEEVMLHDSNPDKQFETHFRNDTSISESDKGFIVTRVNSVIRNWRFLNEVCIRSGIKKDNSPSITAISMLLDGYDLPPWQVFHQLNRKRIIQSIQDIKDIRPIACSIPDWLDERCFAELGDTWIPILNALNQEARIVIRTNTLKINRNDLQSLLRKQGIETLISEEYSEALIFIKNRNIFKLPEFKAGFFEMQDPGSQVIAHFAKPMAGMRIIDACAGNGGKTLHLASLMQNRGRCVALDISPYKLETLKQRCKRAGVTNVETKCIDSTKVIKRLHGTADIVLMDVPCSGLGVLKRNPEIKWRLTSESLGNLCKTQKEILERYSLMVKIGGSVIYSTCSILPSENQLQIQAFLSISQNKFELLEEKTISPELGYDGFYMARLKRLV